MGDEGSPKRIDEALATWRQAERTLDAAVKDREAVEARADVVAQAEAKVAQTAADAGATVDAARQAERSAEAAVAAVDQIADAAQEDVAEAREAEMEASAAREAAHAAHRRAQDEAVQRYRGGSAISGSPDPGLGTAADASPDEATKPGRAG